MARSATMNATIKHVYNTYATEDHPYRWGAAILGGVPLVTAAAMGHSADEALDALDRIMEELPERYLKSAQKLKEIRLNHELFRNGVSASVRERFVGVLRPPTGPGDLIFVLTESEDTAVVVEPIDDVVICQFILPRDMGALMMRLTKIEEFREAWAGECGAVEGHRLPEFQVMISYDSNDDTFVVHLRAEVCEAHLEDTAVEMITHFSRGH
jgi:hypothetical protein